MNFSLYGAFNLPCIHLHVVDVYIPWCDVGDFLHFIVTKIDMEGHPGTVVTLCLADSTALHHSPPYWLSLNILLSFKCHSPFILFSVLCSSSLTSVSAICTTQTHNPHDNQDNVVSLCAVALIISTVTSNKCTGNYYRGGGDQKLQVPKQKKKKAGFKKNPLTLLMLYYKHNFGFQI